MFSENQTRKGGRDTENISRVKKNPAKALRKELEIYREKGVSLFLELDIFKGDLAPLFLAEIEFPDEETARNYQAPDWLGEDVTHLSLYHNSTLSQLK